MTRKIFHPIILFLAIALCGFQLATSLGLVFLDPMIVRAGHVGLVFALIFLWKSPLAKYRKNPEKEPLLWILLDIILTFASSVACLYIITNLSTIQDMMPGIDELTPTQMLCGIIMILVILEATRRTAGLALVIVTLIALIYAFFGHLLPSSVAHLYLEPQRIVESLYIQSEGIWGVSIGASATIIYLFILFGSLLDKSGMSNVFLELACLLTKNAKGGPAKASIFGSALFGSVSGSAAANVYATGIFTIPLMKRVGYKPEFAGAVEAVASSGGLIMPPVMGSIAFVMADYTNIPYVGICKAALFPAILYYVGLFVMIHFEAMRCNIGTTPKELVPETKHLLKRIYYLAPLAILVIVMVNGMSVNFSAITGCASIFVLSCFNKETRFNIKKLLAAIEDSASNMLMICACCACVGIIIGVVGMTGFGFGFVSMMDGLAKISLLLFLIVLTLVCMIFGMGVPALPAYLLVATFGAPTLVHAGIPLVAAHMFVMYFAIVSGITPPVCLVAFAGASIAEGNPMKTGVMAFKLGIAAYLVPFFFIFEPALLLIGDWYTIIPAVVSAIIGIICLASGMQRWMLIRSTRLEQLAFFCGGLCLIYPGTYTDIIGVCVVGVALMLQYVRRRRLLIHGSEF
jgi:TRAP transporter 4TM/12TM fusion protein